MPTRPPHHLPGPVVMLAAAAGVAALAACGSSSKSSTASAPSQPADTSSPAGSASSAASSAAAGGMTITATETEFHIALSQMPTSPGNYTFKATNAGTFPHALTIDGPGVQDKSTGQLSPGKSGSVTVTLKTGQYTIYCPVDGHRGKGMAVNVRIGSAAAPTTDASSSGGTGSGGTGY